MKHLPLKHVVFVSIFLALIFILISCPGEKPTPSQSKPQAPTGLTAKAQTGNILLNWQDKSDNETGFVIYRESVAAKASLETQAFSQLVEVAANITSYEDKSAQVGTQYRYQVSAKNSAGESDKAAMAGNPASPLPTSGNSPNAQDDTLTVPGGKTAILDVLANDTDADKGSLKITSLTSASHGEAVIASDARSILYTPKSGYSGADSFSYTITNSQGNTNSAKVTLTVSAAVSTSGPAFTINNPQNGTTIAGPVFFSVQPLKPDEVASISLQAGDTVLAVDAPGETTNRVFITPTEYAEGALTLTATMTGKNGVSSQKSITVTIKKNLAETGTVAKEGLTLGTVEANGATSVLTIPAGEAEGATVRFDAKTKAEVKEATGVDYDALGVTFLGAQQISSDKPIDQTLMVSSGGFGPMVQPGQAVVNYMIAPDGDGDGIGELVVVNTASFINNDVISDPIEKILLGNQITIAGTSGLYSTHVTGNEITSPITPGSVINIEASGLNIYSPESNIALFFIPSQKEYTVSPIRVIPNGGSSNQIAQIIIPYLPQGVIKMGIVNLTTRQMTPLLDVNIAALPPLLSLEYIA